MKKILVIILSVISLSVFASDIDSVLIRAERFYRQNDFAGAIAQYQALVDTGQVSADLFYNLGNACFKNHDIKSAILNFERAKRLAPNDEAIDFNLQLSRTLIFDKVEPVPELFLITWGKAIRDIMSVRGWAWSAIWAFIVTLAFGLLFLFIKNSTVKRISFGFCVFFFFLCIGGLSCGYIQKSNVERTDEAIVFASSVTVKSSPDDSGNNLFILHEGIKVRIEDHIGEWCEIRIADGNKGWIRKKDIVVI
jgi:tetratricopeptide (TPR) repeat protein